MQHNAPPKGRSAPLGWRSVFFTGLVLWVGSVVVTALTENLNMIPTVVLLGSFLVPASAVVWYLDHYHSPELTPGVVLRAFIVGGVLGVLAVSLLESWLLPRGALAYVGAGLIEELVKLLALVFVARGLARHTIRDGVVLGAAVGFGFAALESSGYALNSLIVPEGSRIAFSLSSLVFTEFLRGVLAPVGHGLWTAILGGVLFGAARNGHLRVRLPIIPTYLLVALLHVAWDSMQGIALLLTLLLTGAAVRSNGQIAIYVALQIGGLAVVSLIGLVVLSLVWRRERAVVHTTAEPGHSPAGNESRLAA